MRRRRTAYNQKNERGKDMLGSFFYGRYGFDALFYGLMAIQAVLIGIAWLAGVLNITALYYVCFFIQLALFIYTFYRVLSKKKDKRQKENARFMTFLGKLKKGKQKKQRRQNGQKRDYYFAVCPHCKANLRLPNVVGKHGVKCPRCGKNFEIEI